VSNKNNNRLQTPFLSNFSQEIKPFESSYWSPKYHVSLNPIVRHTRSNKSLPVDLHCSTENCVNSREQICKVTNITTSRLNSSSASRVQTFTGKDLPDFFLRNGDIFTFRCFRSASSKDVLPMVQSSRRFRITFRRGSDIFSPSRFRPSRNATSSRKSNNLTYL